MTFTWDQLMTLEQEIKNKIELGLSFSLFWIDKAQEKDELYLTTNGNRGLDYACHQMTDLKHWMYPLSQLIVWWQRDDIEKRVDNDILLMNQLERDIITYRRRMLECHEDRKIRNPIVALAKMREDRNIEYIKEFKQAVSDYLKGIYLPYGNKDRAIISGFDYSQIGPQIDLGTLKLEYSENSGSLARIIIPVYSGLV